MRNVEIVKPVQNLVKRDRIKLNTSPFKKNWDGKCWAHRNSSVETASNYKHFRKMPFNKLNKSIIRRFSRWIRESAVIEKRKCINCVQSHRKSFLSLKISQSYVSLLQFENTAHEKCSAEWQIQSRDFIHLDGSTWPFEHCSFLSPKNQPKFQTMWNKHRDNIAEKMLEKLLLHLKPEHSI